MKKIILVAALVFASIASGAPVEEDQRTPLDLRRTTLVVKDIDRSLQFYRDALGMVVIYDKFITTPRGVSVEKADIARRLVFLRANDDFIGVLGLLQYLHPKKEVVDLTDSAFKEGTVGLVFNSRQLQQSLAKASKIEGVKIIEKPSPVSYPSYDGSGTISVLVSTVQDPDGFTVELNQLQEELH